MRHRITFLVEGGKNERGFRTNEWIKHDTVWAALKTLKGRAFYEAAKTNMQHNREFTIRYRQDIHGDMRILWNGQIHEITSIDNDDGLNHTMTIFARVVNPND